MPMTYNRLTEEERYQIYKGMTEKMSHRKIVLLLNKYHSTVSHEVKRHTDLRDYSPKPAQKTEQQRQHNKLRYKKLPPLLLSH